MTDHYNLNLKVIGNGTISALIDQKGTIVWRCDMQEYNIYSYTILCL